MSRRLLVGSYFFLVACFAATQTGRAFHNGSQMERYWCHYNRPWEAAPKDVADALGYQSYYAQITILSFCPSGDLEIYDVGANKVNDDDTVCLSAGDGLNHYIGKWSLDEGRLRLEYRLVWQEIKVVGPGHDEHPLTQVEVPFDGRTFVLDGKTFTPMRNLSKETIERFFSCPPRTE
jgi:hypothetical protein